FHHFSDFIAGPQWNGRIATGPARPRLSVFQAEDNPARFFLRIRAPGKGPRHFPADLPQADDEHAIGKKDAHREPVGLALEQLVRLAHEQVIADKDRKSTGLNTSH